MELRQLYIFRILAKELNFTRAAEQAHCVQSNVSVQIRSMERELGVRLFERLGQKVQLTPHGSKLLPYAERVLRLMEEATAAAKGGHAPAGTLVIGMPESVLTYRLPPVLQLFREKYPDVELIFRAVGSPEVVSQLEEGKLDVALVIEDAIKAPRLQMEALCPEPLVLFAHPAHPLVRANSVRAEDLASQTFLLTDPGCAYRSKLERALAASQIRPNVMMEFSSVEAIKQCAALGMGIACLPKIVVDQELASGELAALPWAGPELVMKALVLRHKDKWLSPAMEVFLNLLRMRLCPATEVPGTSSPGTGTPHVAANRCRVIQQKTRSKRKGTSRAREKNGKRLAR